MEEARKLINDIIDYLYQNAVPVEDHHNVNESTRVYSYTPAWDVLLKAKQLKELLKDMEVKE